MKLTFKNTTPILTVNKLDLEGWDTTKMPPKYSNQKGLVFSNDQDDEKLEADFFNLIKEFTIKDFENQNIEFTIGPISSTKTFEPLDKIPYPFSSVVIGVHNQNFKIRYYTIQEVNFIDDKWNKKWTNDFYFDKLSKVLENETNVELEYEKDDAFISLEITLRTNARNIIEAVNETTNALELLLNKVEHSLNGLEGFFNAIELWDKNKIQKNEAYWQKTFKKYSWILSLAINEPTVIFNNEAFVGGKDLNNTNGNVIDFVFKNRQSDACALIEIKTPQTKLTGKKYRNLFSISTDCTGALNQLLNYKDSFQKDYYSLMHNSEVSFEIISPRCYLIIGNQEKLNKIERKSFELFRKNLSNVTILTYVELFEKIFFVLSILEQE